MTERRTTPGGTIKRISRRQLLKAGAAAGVAGAVGSGLRSSHGRLIEAALTANTSGSLGDVEHIVILMQENRSFDHYFGTMPGVRGFNDPNALPGVFNQTMVSGGAPLYTLADSETSLQPFELISNPPTVAGQTTNDITHDWGPQHLSWNNGAMDQFAVQHLLNDGTSKWAIGSIGGIPLPMTSSAPTGLLTMGYYRQKDCLQFYRALADAFTICDGYHCSVLGPTDPNRLFFMSGSLGAHSGDTGGIVLQTYVANRAEMLGSLNWPTMPEVLTEAGVSWKVYQDPSSTANFNVLPYFSSFAKPSTTAQVQNAANALVPNFPVEFDLDVATGCLPQVSWILPPLPCCEHPATPPEYGEWLVAQILSTLVSNPAVWEKTVFLVVYDENGGFFDHVPPLVAPAPTAPSAVNGYPGSDVDGEWISSAAFTTTAAGGAPSDWDGILGPVGLGFRVPALVISPFSAGGWVCSDTFDHTSVLQLIERAFLPAGTVASQLHISPWRMSTVGDMTAALPNLTTPNYPVPTLPPTSLLFPDVAEESLLNALLGTEDLGQAYPPPASNSTAWQTPDTDSITRQKTPS